LPPDADWARLYYNVCLVDCASKDVLDELLTSFSLGESVVYRLSDRSVVVDARQKAQIQRAFARRGFAYRIVDLPAARPESPDEVEHG
jgi:hypothetical protein